MVKRFLSIIGQEISGMHNAAYLLGIFAFLSQLIGLVRDRLLAHYFGAGEVLDIYYAAFRIPDFIFVTIASLVSFSILIPFLEAKIKKGEGEGKRFMDNIFSSFFLLMLIISAIALFIMPYLNSLLFPSYSPEKIEKISELSRILLLSPLFLGFSNLLASITQLHKRFLLYAITPIIYNASIVFGMIVLMPTLGIKAVVIGVVLGALFHALIQMPYAKSTGLLPDLIFPINIKEVVGVIGHSIPRTLTLASGNIVTIILVSLASTMYVGSISVLNLSLNLQFVPLAIIGMSYSMAAFPVLSKLFAAGDKENFLKQVITASRHIIFLSLPVITLFIVLRAQIVRTVLGSGNFSWNDTRLTAACFAILSISVAAQSLSMLFTRAYYASGKTTRPFIAVTSSSLVSAVLPFYFVYLFQKYPEFLIFISKIFKIDALPGTELLSIPIGYTLGMILQAIIFLFLFHKDFSPLVVHLKTVFLQSLSAALAGGFVSYLSLNIFDNYFDLTKLWGIFMQGFLAGVLGICACALVLKLLGNKEYKEVIKSIRCKIFKVTPVAAEQQEI